MGLDRRPQLFDAFLRTAEVAMMGGFQALRSPGHWTG